MNVEWRYIMRGFGLDGKFFRGLTKAGDFLILGLITVKMKKIMCLKISGSLLRLILSRDYWSNLSWELSDYFYSLI